MIRAIAARYTSAALPLQRVALFARDVGGKHGAVGKDAVHYLYGRLGVGRCAADDPFVVYG